MPSPNVSLSSRARSLSHGVAAIVAGGFGGGVAARASAPRASEAPAWGPRRLVLPVVPRPRLRAEGPPLSPRGFARQPSLFLVKTPTLITCGDRVSNCATGARGGPLDPRLAIGRLTGLPWDRRWPFGVCHSACAAGPKTVTPVRCVTLSLLFSALKKQNRTPCTFHGERSAKT